MPTSMQLSEETKAFIQARLGPAGATPEAGTQKLAALLAEPESTPFYDDARFPVTVPPTPIEMD